MNLLAAMCWLSRATTAGTETRSNRVQRARSGEELTGRQADFSGPIRSRRDRPPENHWWEGDLTPGNWTGTLQNEAVRCILLTPGISRRESWMTCG
jgi:hypothetical protein